MSAREVCFNRRGGEVCTRAAGHSGLHHRGGTGLMWSEQQADAPRCPASGLVAAPAPSLPDGFPDGRALCPRCFAFVPLVAGALVEHDSWRGVDAPADADRRREWFNAHGW